MCFQINSLETTYGGVLSNIYDNLGVKGMPQSCIMNLPWQQFSSNKMMKLYNESCCSICILVRIKSSQNHVKTIFGNIKQTEVDFGSIHFTNILYLSKKSL
jgi:hypothetical protein